MSLIDKYLISEIVKYFLIVLGAVVCIYLAVDFFEKVDDFTEAGVPLNRMLAFFVYQIPLIVAQITPLGILLAVLIVFGLMNKNNEILALQCSGISVYYLLRPVIAIAIVVSLLLFLLSEFFVPFTISKANRIMLVEVDKKSAVTLQAKNIWIKGNRSIFHIRFYDRNKKQAAGISLYFFDQQFNLTRRVDAQRGKFQDDVWIFKEVMEQDLDEKQDAYLVSYTPERKLAVDFLPEDLSRVAKKSEEMNIKELFDYIQDVEAEGYDATLYRVDFYSKMVFPFVCLIVCLVGAGIALRRKRRENLSVSIAFGLGIAFLYWIFHSFCISLGYGGILPAALAPWVTVIVFSCIAGLTLLHAD